MMITLFVTDIVLCKLPWHSCNYFAKKKQQKNKV